MAESRASNHERAAEAFARRAGRDHSDAVQSVSLFGSVARGEAAGRDSDVDLLVVLRDDADRAGVEEALRDIAYDVELEHGLALSLVVKSASELRRQQDRPFLRAVREDAEVLYG
jgi:predicted nucleotidyltransferase